MPSWTRTLSSDCLLRKEGGGRERLISFKSISTLPLEHLKLNLPLESPSIFEEMTESLPKSLTSLSLGVNGVKIQSSSLDSLPVMLGTDLLALELSFSQNSLGDKGTSKLSGALARLLQVRKLKLKLEKNAISEEGVS